MDITPPCHASQTKTLISESLQFQLTPTLRQTGQFEDNSSFISLSNYLQRQDSDLYFYSKQQDQKQVSDICNKNGKKILFFNEDRTHPNTQQYLNDDQSQSLLLLQSQIKQPDSVGQQDCGNNLPNKNEQQDRKQVLWIREHQSSLESRILKSQNSNLCTQSIQLLRLLAIPSTMQAQKIEQKINNNQVQIQERCKLKEMYFSLLLSNYDLLKKVDHISANKHASIESKCQECRCLTKKLQHIENELIQKQKEIKKYESVIEKLNSNLFDLKIQNKSLTFQNRQYLQEIEKYFSKSEYQAINNNNSRNKYSIEREENSLFQNQPNNVIYSGYTNLLQKSATHRHNPYDHYEAYDDLTFQDNLFMHQQKLHPQKVHPQTLMPVSTYKNYKQHQRIQSNHRDKQQSFDNPSDKNIQISISQVRQPSLYEISEMKIDKIISNYEREENKQQNKNYQLKKNKCNHKCQKALARFSDLSNEIDLNTRNSQEDNHASNMVQDQKSRSHIKINAFLKVKQNKQDVFKEKNDMKIKKLHENVQLQTETKIGKKNNGKAFLIPQKFASCQNDGNSLNVNSYEHNGKSNLLLKNWNSIQISRLQFKNKGPFVYKSFKEIGSLYQKTQNTENNLPYSKRHLTTCENNFFEKQQRFDSDDQESNGNRASDDLVNRKTLSPARTFYSTSPQHYHRQGNGLSKSPSSKSPYKKLSVKESMKTFLR